MFRIKRLYIEAAAQDDPVTRRLRQRLGHLPAAIIPSREVLRPSGTFTPADISRGKETLVLARQKGPFWRACPGTREYLCCGYQTLQVMTNCPLDCSYCILQGYFNLPAITIFTNWDDLWREMAQRAAAFPKQVLRLGTGEFGDSLALDEIVGLNRELITRLANWPNIVLEIKSKWHRVEPLLDLGPNPRVIFAWSLNPPRLSRQEEPGAAPLAARLAAAQKCARAGFRLAFHFDPLIYFPGWEEAYQQLVAQLFAAVPATAIAWISLGTLRYLPPLKDIIRARFPASRITAEEFITALDGKQRYFKTLRAEMLSRLRQWLGDQAPGVFVYLCMESPWMWRQVFGTVPTAEELAQSLDRQATAF
ncbi:MAG: radical SAM protein [Desulfobacca sp.]|uniref:SPL family radical SAM protein n=1 Tax=Desulfobacca sp. TaxID=2067990 RepID=UPI00404B52D5